MIDTRLEVVDQAVRSLQPPVRDGRLAPEHQAVRGEQRCNPAAELRSPRSRYWRCTPAESIVTVLAQHVAGPADPSSASGVSPLARAPSNAVRLPPSRRARGRPTPRPSSSRLGRPHGGGAARTELSALRRVLELERVYVDQSPVRMSLKPWVISRLSYSASSRAPAIQPAHRSMSRLLSSETGSG